MKSLVLEETREIFKVVFKLLGGLRKVHQKSREKMAKEAPGTTPGLELP